MEVKRRSRPGITQAETDRQPSRFLWYAGLSMLVFVVAAFGAGAVGQPFRLERYVDPQVVLHIALLLGWMVLFIVQSSLVQRGDLARHEKNVRLGTVLVFLATAHAVYLTYSFGSVERFIGESRDVLAFAALFVASVWFARNGRLDWHKRLMFIATLNLLGPAYTRLGGLFEWWTDPVVVLATALTWMLPPVAYDLVTRRSVHRASIAGIAFSFASFALMLAVVLSPIRGWMEGHWFS